jgi:uncharacterized protein YuzB (UPF0349 family)
MLLLIPLKTTTHFNLTKSLTTWIDKSHPRYSSSQVANDIKRLNALRSDISSNICTSTSHSYAYDKNNNRSLLDLLEYHACLVACTDRGFPTSGRDALVNGTIDAGIQFSWKNAFDKHEESTLTEATKSHFNYEKVCVLWNIAALLTYRAASVHTWDTKEGLTLVKKDYEKAALIFKHIREILDKSGTKSNAITSDLTNASLDMCQYMCLAQGQVCLYEVLKQKLDAKSTAGTYALIAQIATGAAELYDRALKSSQNSVIKFNDSSKIYGAHFKSLSMLFKARAEYLQSLVERSSGQYGIEIARLNRSYEMMCEAIDFTKSNGKQCLKMVVGPASLGKTSLDVMSALRVTVKQRLSAVKKENLTIYHEKIPDDSMLEKIVAKDMMSSTICDSSGETIQLPAEFMPDSLSRPMFASVS